VLLARHKRGAYLRVKARRCHPSIRELPLDRYFYFVEAGNRLIPGFVGAREERAKRHTCIFILRFTKNWPANIRIHEPPNCFVGGVFGHLDSIRNVA